MAYEAKDGRQFGNHQQGRRYDEVHSEKPAVEQKEPNMDEQKDEQDIHSVVAEHGPAHKVEIEHDHAAGRHHVTSHHGEHVHHQEHASAEEAHEHAKVAAGVGEGEEQKETPQFEAGEKEGAAEYAIPGLA